MKKTLKKTAAFLTALLLLVQIVPALAGTYESSVVSGGTVGYRDSMEIVASKGTYVLVGQTLALDVNEGFHPSWRSSDEAIATIDGNGVLTAHAVGEVTITAEENDGKDTYSATAKITVIDPAPNATTPIQPEAQDDNTASSGPRYVVIVINAESARYDYNGEAHTLNTFTATSNQEIDQSLIRVSGEYGVTATACGTYEFKLNEASFSYDDPNVAATFMVNNGWMKIRPAKVTVKANSAEKQEGEADPELTATVEGLYGNDTVSYTLERFAGEAVGQYIIEASGAKDQGNYKVSYEDALFTITEAPATEVKGQEQPLYNIVKIDKTYYRLAKTVIWTDKIIKDNYGKTLSPDDYTVEEYDFSNLEIELNGKKYVYNCKENAEAIVLGANYYEVKGGTVSVVKSKIGAMSNGKPNWIIPEEDRYSDKNETDSIHRDYEITLYNGMTPAVEQTIYNMLSVDGDTNYYKMRATTILAQPIEKVKSGTGQMKPGEYILNEYDFTNVTVTIDGVEYKYNDGSLDEYENYFTAEFENVEKSERFNGKADWYKNTNTWLDGSYEQYGNLPNATVAYHANYKATTHKAAKRPKKVTIDSDWPEGKIAYPGAIITLTATAVGFDENVRYQWQRSAGNNVWEDIPGETGITYTYILDDSTIQYVWRVVAED